MAETEESLRFVDMVDKLVNQPAKYPRAQIPCPNASACRKLRRRFYYMRENLESGPVKEAAAKLSFKTQGRLLLIELEPQWRPTYERQDSTTPISSNDMCEGDQPETSVQLPSVED